MAQSHSELQARKAMREAFKTFDSDKSGSIQIHQLAMLMRKLTQSFHVQDPTQQDINVVFRELDVNGDGKISKKEFDLLVDQIVKIVREYEKEEENVEEGNGKEHQLELEEQIREDVVNRSVTDENQRLVDQQ